MAQPAWLNVLATVIVAVLVLLSLILMATTVFPTIDVTEFALDRRRPCWRSGLGAASGCVALRSRRGAAGGDRDRDRADRAQASSGRCRRWRCCHGRAGHRGARLAMLAPARLPVVSVILLVVKAVQLAGG